MGFATFRSDNPRTIRPGRIVADMLGVAAFEIGDPVAMVVLMEGDDFARKVHQRRITQT